MDFDFRQNILTILRILLASIFCLHCSCAHLWNFNDDSTAGLSQSSDDKSNASEGQSKQSAGSPRSSENSRNSELLDVLMLSPQADKANLLIVLKDGAVFLRDATAAYKGKKILDLPSDITSVAARGGELFAVAHGALVDVYDLKSREKLYSLNRVKTRVSSLEFSPDGEGLLMAGVDGVVYRWQFRLEKSAKTILESEQSLEKYVGHSAVVNMVRYHPFGRVFVSSDWDGALNAWLFYDQDKHHGNYDENIFAGRIFAEEGVSRAKGARKVATIIEQACFSSDGQFLFTGDEKGLIELWGVRGFKHLTQVEAHKGAVYDLALNPTSDRLLSVSRDGKLKTWQLTPKESKLPGVTDYELVLLKEYSLVDLKAAAARKAFYLSNDRALLVNLDGSVQIVYLT